MNHRNANKFNQILGKQKMDKFDNDIFSWISFFMEKNTGKVKNYLSAHFLLKFREEVKKERKNPRKRNNG